MCSKKHKKHYINHTGTRLETMATPGSALLNLHRPAASASAAATPPASTDSGAGYDDVTDDTCTGLLAMLTASASAAHNPQVGIPPPLPPAPTLDGSDAEGSSDDFDGDVSEESAAKEKEPPAGSATTVSAAYCLHDDCVESTEQFASKEELKAHMEMHVTSIREPTLLQTSTQPVTNACPNCPYSNVKAAKGKGEQRRSRCDRCRTAAKRGAPAPAAPAAPAAAAAAAAAPKDAFGKMLHQYIIQNARSATGGDGGGNSKKKYGCPDCDEEFSTWGTCLNHLDTQEHMGQPGSRKGLQQRCKLLPNGSVAVSTIPVLTMPNNSNGTLKSYVLANPEYFKWEASNGTDTVTALVGGGGGGSKQAAAAAAGGGGGVHNSKQKLTTNAGVAVHALLIISTDFKGRTLPKTKAEIKHVVTNLILRAGKGDLPWFQEWISHLLDQGQLLDQISPGFQRKVKKVAKIFIKEWGLLKVLTKGGKGAKLRYTWYLNLIQSVLARHEQLIAGHQRPSTAGVGQSTSGYQAVVGEEDADPSPGMPHTHGIATAARVRLVESEADLRAAIAEDPFLRAETDRREVVAIDCEGVPAELLLLQVATQQQVYVIDCMKIGAGDVCTQLKPLLTSTTTIKLFHDLHNDAVAIATHGSVALLAGCLDSQLVMEFKTGELHMGFNAMLQQSGKEPHPLKARMKREMNGSSETSLFSRRPLAKDVVEYAALDASLLLDAESELLGLIDGSVDMLIQASDQRAQNAVQSGGKRRVCIDDANQHALASRELLECCRPGDMQAIKPLVVSNDVEPLLTLLPPDIAASLADKTEKLSDIILDKGRQAQAWCDGERHFLGTGDAREVSQDDIDSIVVRLGGFGYDNRAGLERQLHRISAIRNRGHGIIGLTMRVGRHVEGNAAMIADLLFHDDSSILFLGEPGSGKTTIVREATRLLAEMSNVLVVDTSNEIAGDGDVPHPCVGLARRLQVASLDDQGAVMIEGVQNHTPAIMVIDEIGRPAEVEAARTCKQRGVRIIASAHGDLRKLIKNKQLRGLIGGVESVTLGDAAGRAAAKKRGAKGGAIDKLQAKRSGAPVFDTIVELRRGEPHEWRIVKGTAKAVDSILEGQQYLTQRRTRNPETGDFYIELERA